MFRENPRAMLYRAAFCYHDLGLKDYGLSLMFRIIELTVADTNRKELLSEKSSNASSAGISENQTGSRGVSREDYAEYLAKERDYEGYVSGAYKDKARRGNRRPSRGRPSALAPVTKRDHLF